MKKSLYIFTNGTKTLLDLECNSGKIITFAENSPLRKLGIDQAFLGHNKETGKKPLSFWQEGVPVLAKVLPDSKSISEVKNFFKDNKRVNCFRF